MDLFLFTEANVLAQMASADCELGYYRLRFYTDNGRPVNKVTPTTKDFYLYPSGGTLRDADFHIVLYDSRFDTYRGFTPPARHGTHPA